MVFPYRIIDLTHILNEQVPSWNGACGFHHDMHIDYSDCEDEDKFRVMKIKMHAGIGTHIDAPSHCILGGKCIDDFEVNDLIMPSVVIDVSAKCHERYSLSVQDVIDFENQFGSIKKNSCVMIKTGWSALWNQALKYHNKHVFPSVSAEAAELLIKKGVSALGIDTLSPDRPEDGFKVHQIFLGAGKILIENVANLNSMPALDGFVMILPLKIKDGTEAPVRLIGLIERGKHDNY